MNKPAERVVSSEAARSAAFIRAIGSGLREPAEQVQEAQAGPNRRFTEDLATVDRADYLGE